jgi:hypothetical protein
MHELEGRTLVVLAENLGPQGRRPAVHVFRCREP